MNGVGKVFPSPSRPSAVDDNDDDVVKRSEEVVPAEGKLERHQLTPGSVEAEGGEAGGGGGRGDEEDEEE